MGGIASAGLWSRVVSRKLGSYLTYKLDLLKSELVRQVNEQYRSALGLSIRDFRILRKINESPGIQLNHLQAETFIEKTVLSKMVSNLVELGLMTRSISPHDARAYELHLTDAGQRLREQADQVGEHFEKTVLFADFTAAEMETLDQLLDKLMKALRSTP